MKARLLFAYKPFTCFLLLAALVLAFGLFPVAALLVSKQAQLPIVQD